MEFEECYLADICKYRKEKISTKNLKRENYISTENMLPEKQGIGGLSDIPQNGNVDKFENEDVLISNIRPYFKKIWFSNKNGGSSPDVLIFQADKEKIIPQYLYYILSQDSFFNYMVQTSKGTKMPRGDKNAIMQYKIPLYNKKYQMRIVNFLRNLDDKIRNNKSIINNFKRLSQVIFKQWFIDYDFPNEEGNPYKSSGGELIETQIGKIPKEWIIGKFDDLGSIVGGGTPSKKHDDYYTKCGISWITPKDLSKNKNTFIYKGSIDITELGLKKGSARVLPKNTVLFTSRAPIGYIAIAGQKVTTNQGFKSIVPNKGYSSYFIYHLLNFKLPIIEAAASGSTFKEISGNSLKGIPIPLPDPELENKFKELVSPFFLQIQTLEQENKSLIQLREILLPKLLSGEIELLEESGV